MITDDERTLTNEDKIRAKLFLGKTQAEVARELGVSRAYVNDLFHGRCRLSSAILSRLGYERVIVKREYIKRARGR